jgi:hypothetical protein
MKIPNWLRASLLALTLLGLMAPAACAGAVNQAGDDLTVRPAAVTMPNGQVCTPWMNNPHEAELYNPGGPRACDYPIPTDRPVQQPGMSPLEFAGLMYLFNVGMGHHDFYYGGGYYNSYIGPAWNRWPGSYYGYGHAPITRVVDARTYNTTIIHNVDTKYAADEKRASSDPKYSTYKTASGKTYTGSNVPKASFKSSNVPVSGPAGDAPTRSTKPQTGSSNSGTSSGTRPSTGGSYSKPSTGSGTRPSYSKPSSGSSGSRSSGGGRR